jgi:hypothetical protein
VLLKCFYGDQINEDGTGWATRARARVCVCVCVCDREREDIYIIVGRKARKTITGTKA